jgi:hypothetical protein
MYEMIKILVFIKGQGCTSHLQVKGFRFGIAVRITIYKQHFLLGKAVVQIAAIEIAIDHLLDIGPPESVLPGEMLVIDPDKGFKIVLYAAVKIGSLRVPWTINGGRGGHDFSPLRKSNRSIIESIPRSLRQRTSVLIISTGIIVLPPLCQSSDSIAFFPIRSRVNKGEIRKIAAATRNTAEMGRVSNIIGLPSDIISALRKELSSMGPRTRARSNGAA